MTSYMHEGFRDREESERVLRGSVCCGSREKCVLSYIQQLSGDSMHEPDKWPANDVTLADYIALNYHFKNELASNSIPSFRLVRVLRFFGWGLAVVFYVGLWGGVYTETGQLSAFSILSGVAFLAMLYFMERRYKQEEGNRLRAGLGRLLPYILEIKAYNETYDFRSVSHTQYSSKSNFAILEYDGFFWFSRFGITYARRKTSDTHKSSTNLIVVKLGSELKLEDKACSVLTGMNKEELFLASAHAVGDGVGVIADQVDWDALGDLSDVLEELDAAHLRLALGALNMTIKAAQMVVDVKLRRDFFKLYNGLSLVEIDAFDNTYTIPWSYFKGWDSSKGLLNSSHTIVHDHGTIEFKKLGEGRDIQDAIEYWMENDSARIDTHHYYGLRPIDLGIENTRPTKRHAWQAAFVLVALAVAHFGYVHNPSQNLDDSSTIALEAPSSRAEQPPAPKTSVTPPEEPPPSPSVASRTDPTTEPNNVLLGICDVSPADSSRCARCPDGLADSDTVPETMVKNRIDFDDGTRLVEVEDHVCLPHANAFRTVYVMSRTQPSERLKQLADIPGAKAADCVKLGSVVVCASSYGHHGSAGGAVVAIDTATGKRTELLEFVDSLEGTCSARHAIQRGFSFSKFVVIGSTLTVNLTRRHGRMPLDSADRCDAEDSGRFTFETAPVEVSFEVGERGIVSTDGLSLPAQYGQWEPSWITPSSLTDASARRILNEMSESREGWVLYHRRLDVLRFRGHTAMLQAMTKRLIVSHPEHAAVLLTELVEACEASRDYVCAMWAHEQRLTSPNVDGIVALDAAWFFTTAAPFRDLKRAKVLIEEIDEDPKIASKQRLVLAELALHHGDLSGARALLDGLVGEEAESKRAKIESGDPLETAPRKRVNPRPYKGAREWGDTPPTDLELGPEELVVGLHIRAQALAKKKDYEAASALYKEARQRVKSLEVEVVIELGWGKLHERAGKILEAYEHYRALTIRFPDHDRILNRAAWFALTRSEVHDLEQGFELATRAARLTNHEDPSVLDTLVEAHIQREEWDQALVLNARCSELDPARRYYERRREQIERKMRGKRRTR